MVRPAVVAVVVALGALGGAACGSDESPTLEAGNGAAATGPSTSVPGDTTSTGVLDRTTTATGPVEAQSISLTLTGDAVAPSPVATAGTAEATLTYDGDQLCLDGTTTGLGPVSAGHVHAGPVGESGPVVVDLGITTTADGPFRGCAVVGAEGGVVVADPASYYAQLHTPDHPDGAARAQVG